MQADTANVVSPVILIKNIWMNRNIIMQLTKRQILGRYKGSFLGLGWSIFNPIFILFVYTFVFSVVFKARWNVSANESRLDFAIVMFVGVIIHGLFAEVINSAPSLILSNVNYVKKILFPLEILPLVSMCSALFHAVISLLVLIFAFAITNHYMYWTATLLPLVLLPLILIIVGLGWMLASLGVFLRDVSQTISILTTALLFLSPVFYPISALPPEYQLWLMANPLTLIIEQARQVLIFGNLPDWAGLGKLTLIGIAVSWIGFIWFQKTRKGFADVI